MRLLVVAFLLCSAADSAGAGDLGAPLGAASGSSLLSPGTSVIGKTAPTRLRTLGVAPLAPAGPLGAESRTRDRGEALRPIERRLDCFETPLTPDRDERNRFLSRCPSNPSLR